MALKSSATTMLTPMKQSTIPALLYICPTRMKWVSKSFSIHQSCLTPSQRNLFNSWHFIDRQLTATRTLNLLTLFDQTPENHAKSENNKVTDRSKTMQYDLFSPYSFQNSSLNVQHSLRLSLIKFPVLFKIGLFHFTHNNSERGQGNQVPKQNKQNCVEGHLTKFLRFWSLESSENLIFGHLII